MTTSRPAALLWDFDGTIVDTEGVWLEEETAVAADFDIDLPERFWERTMGGTVMATCTYFAGLSRRPGVTPAQIADALVGRMVCRLAREEPRWLPGARALLEEARQAGIPQAVVSASNGVIVRPVIAHLPKGTFAATVVGEDVTAGKPHPDPYLLAAARLGVDPASCLAIEDSPNGAASANAAGCAVLTVAPRLTPPPALRRVSRHSLDGLTVDDLDAIYAEACA